VRGVLACVTGAAEGFEVAGEDLPLGVSQGEFEYREVRGEIEW